MRVNQPRRRGNVIVMTAASLVMIVAVTALSIDGGMLLDKRRAIQATTAAAALAAAGELYQNYPTYLGADTYPTNGLARHAAFAAFPQDGFVNGTNFTVTVNIPPPAAQIF